jgi:prevent-host-death family protein
MSSSISARSRRGASAEPPRVSASDAKNGFGRLLDRVAREGRLAITKHDEPCAMLISIDEYRVLAAARDVTLDTLSAEFDALFDRMQEPAAAAAMRKAFAMTPTELGRAAVQDHRKDHRTPKAAHRRRG